jgi:DNA-binding response OmpR family regulator
MDRHSSVLVVDGDPESRAALTRALQRAGYPTQQARTGEEALQAAGRQRPALVIMETHLPGASGYEISREMRERYGEELPIIFVSAARTDETDRVAGLLLGADDYLAKPVAFDHLLARLACVRHVGHPRTPADGRADQRARRRRADRSRHSCTDPRGQPRILAFWAANSSSVRMPWSLSCASCLSCSMGSSAGGAAAAGAGA